MTFLRGTVLFLLSLTYCKLLISYDYVYFKALDTFFVNSIFVYLITMHNIINVCSESEYPQLLESSVCCLQIVCTLCTILKQPDTI